MPGYPMKGIRFGLVAISFLCACGSSAAAERRQWETLNCAYVAARDNDGDSFLVQCGGKQFRARLYFVDTPEPDLSYPERTREQSEYFGVTLDETIKAGAKARELVAGMLKQPFVVQTRWAIAAGRGRETRYYALVSVGGKSIAEALVSRGLARTKGVFVNLPTGEKSKAYAARLEELELAARQRKLGIWAGARHPAR